MQPGRIEFIDEGGSAASPGQAEDQLHVEPARARRFTGPVPVLAVVVVALCGGVLWHQHGNRATHRESAPAHVSTVQPGPSDAPAARTGIRPTGELLAEAQQELRSERGQSECMTRVQAGLNDMGAAYESVLAAGGSPREAERAARAALADAPDAGVSAQSYDAMFRVWRINRTALSTMSGERLSVDMSAYCPG